MKNKYIIKVFVHIAYGMDSYIWHEKFMNGSLIGINESYPYGYIHANDMGCEVKYSSAKKESRIAKLWRLMWLVALGFDFIHALDNVKEMKSCDVIWTHTESQTLAILLLRKLNLLDKHPKLIGQSVWLFDRWKNLFYFRKIFFSWLLKDADVLTVHSPVNQKYAQALLPKVRVEFVKFGISKDVSPVHKDKRIHGKPLRILSVGNDRHRDWKVLINAICNNEKFELRIVSGTISSRLLAGVNNVSIFRPKNNAELFALYAWADVSVVPLKKNMHASGITVIQESVLMDTPVICTKVGGLESYFSDDEIFYIEPDSCESLKNALARLDFDDSMCTNLSERASLKMSNDLGSIEYVKHHVSLSHELLRS